MTTNSGVRGMTRHVIQVIIHLRKRAQRLVRVTNRYQRTQLQIWRATRYVVYVVVPIYKTIRLVPSHNFRPTRIRRAITFTLFLYNPPKHIDINRLDKLHLFSNMKFVILFSLSVCTSGFVIHPQASPSTRVTTPTLDAATTLSPHDRIKDDWSEKPLTEHKQTVPVAKNKVSRYQRSKLEDVIIPPDFFLAWSTALLGPLIWWYHPCT